MRYCFWDTERKNLYVYINSMSNNLNIALYRSFSMAFGMALHGKSDIISQTTVNFNCFLSVKNMLEELRLIRTRPHYIEYPNILCNKATDR